MKFVNNLGILSVIISGILHCGVGEVRFICPRPQTPKSNVMQGPCDPDGLNEDSYVTDVSPGPLTVRWEETVLRSGSPSRIALKSRSENTTCILLDQIPHNDNQFTSKGNSCDVVGYPIGSCLRSMTVMTVLIPDIRCDDCYLQLISVDTSSPTLGNATCDLDDTNSTCPVYYSCASIKIWPTTSGEGRALQSCISYPDNLNGEWPYLPITTLGVNADFASAYFTRDLVEIQGITVTYDVRPIGLEASEVVNGTEGLYDAATGLIARVFSRPSGSLLTFQGSTDLPEEFLRTRLLSGKLAFGIRSVEDGLIIFPLEVKSTRFGLGQYEPHTAEYTSRGLLRSNRDPFSGSSTITPFRQSGPCALNTRIFNAGVMMNPDGNVEGLLALSVVEYSAFVKGVFPRTPDSSMALSLTRSFGDPFQSINRVAVPNQFISSDNTSFILDGIVDLEDFFVLSAGALPANVEARLNSPDQTQRTLNGTLLPGIFAAIHDEEDQLTGLVSLNFNDRNTLDTKLMLVNFPTIPQLGGLHGPAHPGRIGPQLFLPTSNVSLRSVGTNAWIVSAHIGITSVKALRHFWEGLLYIDVKRNSSSPSRSVSAQLNHLDRNACGNSISSACLISELQIDGFSRGGSTVPVNAFVAFLPGNNGQFEFSIIVRDLQPGETVTSIRVTNEATGEIQTITPNFTASQTHSNAVEGEGSFVMPSTGELRMSLSTSLSSGSIEGEIPKFDEQPISTQAESTTTSSTTSTRAQQQSVFSPDDFRLDCGTRESGPMSITFNSGAVNIDSVYAVGFSQTCSFAELGSLWQLPNARASNGSICGMQRISGVNWLAYEVTVIVQVETMIETMADTRVTLSCNFTGTTADQGTVVVTSSIDIPRNEPVRKQEVIRGNVDQTYSLNIYNGTDLSRLVSRAVLGESIALSIDMAGTDQDEQSLHVVQCKARDNRGNEVILLDNYCPVLRSVLPGSSGFITSGQRAVLSGLQAFRMKDSPDDTVIFSCIVEPCGDVQQCNGDNCGAGNVGRRRRESDGDDQGAALRLATSYRVVDIWENPAVDNGDAASQTGESLRVSQFTLLITVSVISCLLLLTLVICISVYCQLRRLKRDQKSSA